MINDLATEYFGMRIRPEEKRMLSDLAQTLKRSQSDTIRVLINDAYSDLETNTGQLKRKRMKAKRRTLSPTPQAAMTA